MKLINLASRFQSKIIIHFNGREADAKDILNVMMLGATQGSEIELIISGEDEVDALQMISQLIDHSFGEMEE